MRPSAIRVTTERAYRPSLRHSSEKARAGLASTSDTRLLDVRFARGQGYPVAFRFSCLRVLEEHEDSRRKRESRPRPYGPGFPLAAGMTTGRLINICANRCSSEFRPLIPELLPYDPFVPVHYRSKRICGRPLQPAFTPHRESSPSHRLAVWPCWCTVAPGPPRFSKLRRSRATRRSAPCAERFTQAHHADLTR